MADLNFCSFNIFYIHNELIHMLLKLQGMDFTTDKLRSLVKKRQSLIEAHVDVKTTDSYTLRLFVIAFTKKRVNQQKTTCYAQSSQIRQVKYLTMSKTGVIIQFCYNR